MTLRPDKTIGVVGAGIIGLTMARALQKKGYKVLLFDPEDPGLGTSFGNAGYIAVDEIIPLSHGISPLAVVKMLLNPLAPLAIRWQQFFNLVPWFLKFIRYARPERAAKSAEALAALQGYSQAAWKTLVREEKLAKFIRTNGAMIVFETEKGFKEESRKFGFLEKFQVRFSILEGDEARKMVPELSPSVKKAVFYPNGAHVTSPYAISKHLFENFKEKGGRFIKSGVRGFANKEGKITSIRIEEVDYPVDAVVISAGHKSGTLLAPLGIKVPLVAERGYHKVMDHKPLGFDLTLGSHERGFFITPMNDGLRLAGTVEFSPANKNPPPNWKRAEILKTHTKELLPGVITRERSRWMGHRPTLPDFLPALGKTQRFQNLYLNFGHQHLGLTLGPVSAQVMADLISTGKSPIDLTPFEIQRF